MTWRHSAPYPTWTPYWVDYLDDVRDIEDASCSKINQAGGTAFVMPAEPDGEDWVLVVIEQGVPTSSTTTRWPVTAYPSVGPNAPGFSHVIVCSVEEQVTTTTAGETTTTAGETTTTAGDDDHDCGRDDHDYG